MAKPKLLVAVDSYLPRWDGIARSLSELLPHMVRTFEIRLIIPDFPGERPAMDGVTYVALPLIPFLKSGDLRFPLVRSSMIRSQVGWADMVWTHTAAGIGGACIKQAHKLNKPIVSMVHSNEWVIYSKTLRFGKTLGMRAWLSIAKSRYNLANLIITPGEMTRKELLHAGIKPKIQVVPLGVSLQRFHPLPSQERLSHLERIGLPSELPIIGYLGRFAEEKSLNTLIAAHKILSRDCPTRLLLVGGTRSQLPRGRLLDTVIVKGPTTEPQLFFQAMDVFVLPSLTESFPLGILEAMACGIPPVTTPVGATTSYIIHAKNGYLFPPKKDGVLAETLRACLASSERRKKVGEEARRTVEKGFSWEGSARELVNILLNFV